MVVDRVAQEREAMRRQAGSHTFVEEAPSARAMGAESAQYMEPSIDPQWMDAWKMFLDAQGNEYGVPVRVPRGQWDQGGANALMNQRRPDGGFWFTMVEPERKLVDPQYACFVGECRKRLHKRIQLVHHVRASHYEEAEAYKDILLRIERQVAQDDPRLQRVLASLDAPEPTGPADDELPLIACRQCGTQAPDDHPDPEVWLRRHTHGAHPEGEA